MPENTPILLRRMVYVLLFIGNEVLTQMVQSWSGVKGIWSLIPTFIGFWYGLAWRMTYLAVMAVSPNHVEQTTLKDDVPELDIWSEASFQWEHPNHSVFVVAVVVPHHRLFLISYQVLSFTDFLWSWTPCKHFDLKVLKNLVSTKYPKCIFLVWKLKPMHWQVFFNIINHDRLFLSSWKVVTAGFFEVETQNCKYYSWQGSLCLYGVSQNLASMEWKPEAMHLENLGRVVYLQNHQLFTGWCSSIHVK